MLTRAWATGIIDATLDVPYRIWAMTNRLDVRLDSEHRRRLKELAEENGVPISEVVRRLIDGAYEDILRARRKQAIERLIGLNVEDPPDPDILSRELEASHEPGGLY
jgi:predicted DNA-binding protein